VSKRAHAQAAVSPNGDYLEFRHPTCLVKGGVIIGEVLVRGGGNNEVTNSKRWRNIFVLADD
jgi:hypothetical protein